VWNPEAVADAAANALSRRASELRLEQSVRGLDGLDEVSLHPILSAGFAEAGFGVYPEHPYPGEVQRRARRAERERCDLVLTPEAGQVLLDPVAELRQRDAASGTLFEPMAASIAARATAARAVPPEDACWVEVKAVGQFTFTAGVPGPNRAYTSELLGGPVEDLIKLEWERAIRFGAALVVLFTADAPTAQHDLGVLMHRCLDREVPVQTPVVRHFPIPDLIGNADCAVCLIPLRARA
jgi:hypothetical protein